MQNFTCQTGPLSLALRVGEEDELPPSSPLVRVPRELASLGADQVSVREAEGRGAERREAGENLVSREQGEETTRKHWCLGEVQEVYRNESHGVIYSLFLRFPTLTKLFWCQNCSRALSLCERQSLLVRSVTKPCYFSH